MYGALLGFILGLLARVKQQPHGKPDAAASRPENAQPESRPVIVTYAPPALTDEEITQKKERERREKTKFKVEKGGLFVLILYTGFTGFIAWETKEATKATKIAADAAAKAATTAQQQLEMSERPWITVTITFEEPPHAHSAAPSLFFNPDGSANLNAFVVIKNIGHSVATSIHVHPMMYPTTLQDLSTDPINRQKVLCDKVRGETQDAKRLPYLFPGEESTLNFTFGMNKEDIHAALQNNPPEAFGRQPIIFPVIYGCVNYTFSFSNEIHQTPILYQLVPVRVAPGVIPGAKLELIKIFAGKAPD